MLLMSTILRNYYGIVCNICNSVKIASPWNYESFFLPEFIFQALVFEIKFLYFFHSIFKIWFQYF